MQIRTLLFTSALLTALFAQAGQPAHSGTAQATQQTQQLAAQVKVSQAAATPAMASPTSHSSPMLMAQAVRPGAAAPTTPLHNTQASQLGQSAIPTDQSTLPWEYVQNVTIGRTMAEESGIVYFGVSPTPPQRAPGGDFSSPWTSQHPEERAPTPCSWLQRWLGNLST
jgi:hypothetical protein